jgi:hypothetical protein
MPIWAWIGLIVLSAYSAFRLVRSLRTGTSSYGPFTYARDRDALIFWFFTAVDGALLAFFAGLWLLILKHQLFD